MSAEESRALVERYFAAFNDRSIAGMLDCLHEDVAHDVNQGGRRIGKEQFEAFSLHMARCYRETLTDMVVMVSADGTRAAAEYTVKGTYLQTDEGLPPADGQTYSLSAGTFLAIEDGLIIRVTTYYNLPDWIRQVSA